MHRRRAGHWTQKVISYSVQCYVLHWTDKNYTDDSTDADSHNCLLCLRSSLLCVSVWWCTGVCTDWHLTTLLTCPSQPSMLLLAAAVYDLPTWTVSLCLAVNSAFQCAVLAWQSGTRCQRNLKMWTALTVLNGFWKQFSLSTARWFYKEMWYIIYVLLCFTLVYYVFH